MTHASWLPSRRFPASHAKRTFFAALALPLLRALYSATTPAKDDKKKVTTSAAAPDSAEKDALQRQQQLYMLLVDLLLLSQEPRWSTAARGRAPLSPMSACPTQRR